MPTSKKPASQLSATSPGSDSFGQAALFWARLGWVSFGGPAGQIALLQQELVVRRRWLSEGRFLHALSYCMLLPGPEATQLATYLGWLMHGTAGGLLAGVLFLGPSALVLTGLATLYALWGQLPLLSAVFAVLKPAVLAVVLVAAWRLGRRTLHTALQRALAFGAFAALTLFNMPYPWVIALAAIAGWLAAKLHLAALQGQPSPQATPESTPAQAALEPIYLHGDTTPTPAHAVFSSRRLALTVLAWGIATLLPLAALSHWGGWDGTLALMARFFSRVALLSFGGAYAVLPYVAQGAVEQFGWLSASQMLDGLALGETTPGPLIMVVAFVGFMGGWSSPLLQGPGSWPAAAAATLVTVWFSFVPSFALILAGAPLMEASRDDLRLGAPLRAISCAVVGVIVSLAVLLARPVLWPAEQFSFGGLVVMALALWLQLKAGWGVLPLIGTAAAAGAAAAIVRLA